MLARIPKNVRVLCECRDRLKECCIQGLEQLVAVEADLEVSQFQHLAVAAVEGEDGEAEVVTMVVGMLRIVGQEGGVGAVIVEEAEEPQVL